MEILGSIICILLMVLVIYIIKLQKELKDERQKSKRYKFNAEDYLHWLQKLQNNEKLEEYFLWNDLKSIAIYGNGFVGKMLEKELKDTDVEVKYFIDKNGTTNTNVEGIPIFNLKEEFPVVDAIVVSVSWDYDTIEEFLMEKTDIEIIALSNILSV